ncbi:MAG: DUF4113 domain-containing protein, partial [Prevotella sp.]|nr:DUF4113 domain-containing protein [Prevotella sp.]
DLLTFITTPCRADSAHECLFFLGKCPFFLRDGGKTFLSFASQNPRWIDSINNRSGFGAVRSASQGEQRRYKLKSEHLSQRFSTNLNETIIVKSD